jgi:hypothetical protein
MAIRAAKLGTHTRNTSGGREHMCSQSLCKQSASSISPICTPVLTCSPLDPFCCSLHTVVLVRRAMKVLHQQQAQKNGGGWGGGASGFGGHGGSIRGSYSTASAIGPRDANEQVPISCRDT